MNARLFSALREIAEYMPHQGYWWRKSSMEKLEFLGYVERFRPSGYAGNAAFRITRAGRAKLAELEGKK